MEKVYCIKFGTREKKDLLNDSLKTIKELDRKEFLLALEFYDYVGYQNKTSEFLYEIKKYEYEKVYKMPHWLFVEIVF